MDPNNEYITIAPPTPNIFIICWIIGFNSLILGLFNATHVIVLSRIFKIFILIKRISNILLSSFSFILILLFLQVYKLCVNTGISEQLHSLHCQYWTSPFQMIRCVVILLHFTHLISTMFSPFLNFHYLILSYTYHTYRVPPVHYDTRLFHSLRTIPQHFRLQDHSL